MAIFLFVSLIVLILLSLPIAFALGLSPALTVYFGDISTLMVVAQQIYNKINSFPLMAIPFFILAGNLMQNGGISERLINFADSLVGHISGGLAMTTIVTSMFFAAMSGSGSATTAAVGSILIPAMIAKGYHGGFAAATQSVAGSLGVIIPPSITMILYGVTAQQSIGDLFLAGVFPGLLIGFSLLLLTYVIAKKRGYTGNKRASLREVLTSFRKAFLSLLMPLIVLGGIYSGVFTPTEAAIAAVVYAFILGFVIYREIKLKDLVKIFRNAAEVSAIILITIGAAGLYGFVINKLNIPLAIGNFFTSISDSPYVFLFIVTLLMLFVGMFVEDGAAVLIFTPILFPTAMALGVDPIHFGVIMIACVAVGMFTPPVGVNLFVASMVSKISITRIAPKIVPFVIVIFIDILIIAYFPALSTWLPSVIGQ